MKYFYICNKSSSLEDMYYVYYSLIIINCSQLKTSITEKVYAPLRGTINLFIGITLAIYTTPYHEKSRIYENLACIALISGEISGSTYLRNVHKLVFFPSMCPIVINTKNHNSSLSVHINVHYSLTFHFF